VRKSKTICTGSFIRLLQVGDAVFLLQRGTGAPPSFSRHHGATPYLRGWRSDAIRAGPRSQLLVRLRLLAAREEASASCRVAREKQAGTALVVLAERRAEGRRSDSGEKRGTQAGESRGPCSRRHPTPPQGSGSHSLRQAPPGARPAHRRSH
jgi:hypothetical protein